jgi:ethanolamine transporter
MAIVSRVVTFIIGVFAALGLLDRIIKEWKPDLKLPLIDGWGKEVENGFGAMGPLALAMVGIIALTPVLADLLIPIVGPVYTALLSRPAMFAGTLLAIDMGATPMGLALAQAAGDPEWVGWFGGMLLGAVFGVNIVFNIPVGLSLIQPEDRKYLGLGLLAGIVVAPIGALVSGVLAGYPFMQCLLYLVPVILVGILIAIGLAVAQNAMVKGFIVFGHFITSLILFGLLVALFQQHTGITIIPGMAPLFTHCDGGVAVMEGLEVIGAIAIALAGAYPLVKFLTQVLGGPLGALGKKLGMNDIAAAGLVATLANNIPMFGIFKDMNPRGKVLNAAFQVAAAFSLADHLGFAAANNAELIGPMLGGKIVAGILGIVVAMFFAPKE